VRIGGIEVATDAAGALTLKFRRSNPAAFISTWKLLAGGSHGTQISAKIILLWKSKPGLFRTQLNPLATLVPGVEIQAQAIENILGGRRLARPDYALAAEQSLVVVLGLLMAFTLPRLTPGLAAGLGAMLLAAITGIGWIAFRYWDLLFDPV